MHSCFLSYTMFSDKLDGFAQNVQPNVRTYEFSIILHENCRGKWWLGPLKPVPSCCPIIANVCPSINEWICTLWIMIWCQPWCRNSWLDELFCCVLVQQRLHICVSWFPLLIGFTWWVLLSFLLACMPYLLISFPHISSSSSPPPPSSSSSIIWIYYLPYLHKTS